MTSLSLEERQSAIADLCSARELDPELVRKLGGSERWKTYRHMVRTRLSNMVRAGLPRTMRALGKETSEARLSDWFASGGLKSAYIRDAVLSFHAATDWAPFHESATPWIPDLARYETKLWELRHLETPAQEVIDFAFEAKPVLNRAAECLHLDYPVYRKSDETFARDPKQVLLFRHMVTDKVGYMTLTPLQARLFESMVVAQTPTEPKTLVDNVKETAKKHDLPVDEALLETVTSFLADLMSKTVLVGSRPASGRT